MCARVRLQAISSNCCRRFCSERCATRSHVAAHRARKRAATDEPAVDEALPLVTAGLAETGLA